MTDVAIAYPEFHDGYLQGYIVREDVLSLILETPGKELSVMEVPGILEMTVDNFKAGNIVFDVMVYDLPDAPKHLLDYAYSYTDHGGTASLISEEQMNAVRQSSGCCLHLDTSFGCKLVAVSKFDKNRITVKRLDENVFRLTP